MANRRSTFAQRNFNLMLCNHWTRQRGAEQIFVFIDRARFQRRPDVASQKFFAQILDLNFAGSSFICLADDALDVTQETLVYALQRLPEPRDRTRFGGWLRNITILRCADYRR